jgi:integrase
MALSDIQIRNAKPKDKQYKMTDSEGMYLLVSPNGSKLWRLKYRYLGKEKTLALGSYPEITLVKAREKRMDARKLLAQEIDPSSAKKEAKREKRIKNNNTFEAVAREWHAKKQSGWSPRYAATLLMQLEANLLPQLGKLPIGEITPPILLDALQQLEKRGVYEITRKAKQMCGQIFRYAIPKGMVTRDITVDLKDALETRKTVHFASLEPDELPQFIKDLNYNAARMYPTTRLAVEFMMHTFVRTNEMIQAKWTEFNFQDAMWTVPAERMKMGKAHLVPLSRQVLKILEEMKLHNGNFEWVFASHTRPRNHMSDNAILKALERMGYRGRMTGHGFRSLAMTTILEKMNYPFDVVDAQLAHAKQNSLGEAYDRAKYLAQRKVMMQDWSDYLERITVGGENIVNMKFGTK